MKLEIHSTWIGTFTTTSFLKSIKAFAESLACEDKNIKKVYLYSDFCSPNGEYPFIYNDTIYYPLTLVYKAEKWKVQWICWNKNDVSSRFSSTFPFRTKTEINISKCDYVPEKFNNMILNKQLYFSQKSNCAVPEVGLVDFNKDLGKINTSFEDELCRQISEKLMEISGCDLSPKWSIFIYTHLETVSVDQVNYRLIKLKTGNAESMDIGVCWKEDYDVCDYVTSKDVKFELTEFKFHPWVHSLEKIQSFVKNEGYSSVPHSRNKLSYPDVTIDFQFKETVEDYEKNQILNCIGKYVAMWNNNENHEEKIHDFFLIDDKCDKSVSVYVDFGNCDPVVLENMLSYFREEYLVNNPVSENIVRILLDNGSVLYEDD